MRSTFFPGVTLPIYGNFIPRFKETDMSLLLLTTPNSMAVILISIFLWLLIIQLVFRKLNEEQGKKYHPIGGTVLNQLMNFNRLPDYMADLARKHKTYRFISLLRSEVYTSDPANVEYMLKTNFENFGKGWYICGILNDLFGGGIFAVDGHQWREQRKVLSHEFSTRVLREFSSVVFRKNVVKLANIVSEAAVSNQPMDIQDLFMKSTLDSIFNAAFGTELDSISGSNKEAAKFCNAFDDSSALTIWRFVDILWKIKKAFCVGSEAKLKKSIKVVDEFVYELISSKSEQIHKPSDETSIQFTKEDVLSRLLQLTDTNPKYLRDIVLNLIIAGKDTTSATLSWFIYMLCKHPLVQEKVAQEIKDATGSKEVANFSDVAAGVSEAALEKMHYLHAVLTETIRLYPSVAAVAKLCLSDDTFPDGFNVKKGDMVAYQPYAMGRMKFIWGDDAEEFIPERWLDKNGCFQQESPFKFTAFQGGPRICLGKQFAYRQMKVFSAVLVRCFVFKLNDDTKVAKYRSSLTLQIDGGLSVRAFHRSY